MMQNQFIFSQEEGISQTNSKEGISPSSKAVGEEGESSAMRNSALPEEYDNVNLLAPLQLASENEKLRRQLAAKEQQIIKTEEKLEKKRRFIREMQGLQQDLTLIKQTQ